MEWKIKLFIHFTACKNVQLGFYRNGCVALKKLQFSFSEDGKLGRDLFNSPQCILPTCGNLDQLPSTPRISSAQLEIIWVYEIFGKAKTALNLHMGIIETTGLMVCLRSLLKLFTM